MLKKLAEKVAAAISTPQNSHDTTEVREAALRMATAVLMIDVARADHSFDDAEMNHIMQLIKTHFELEPDAAAELFKNAGEQAEDLVGLHEFTKLLHENLDESEKAKIVSLLWSVAFADGQLDKYEDSLVLKISDLLYVSRGRVMRLKHDAELQSR